MQSLRKEDWRYAFLLVLLFAIATLATQALINYILPLVNSPEDHLIVTILLCILTFGLMLISGAFGLWAIKLEASSVSMRRIGDIVSSLSYIKDGVLSLNRKGIITGMNPAARKLLNSYDNKKNILSDLCPTLSDNDIKILHKSSNQEEIESLLEHNGNTYNLRFRSQPSKDVTIILINDVTRLSSIRTRRRHAAYLQLIGHISQGVANDFNNLLCGISGHASLITHPGSKDTTIQQSAKVITESANRGIQLAGRLLELSNTNQNSESATMHPALNVNAATDGIDADLHSSWEIIRNIDSDIEPTNLTAVQIEHIIHGLGILATDTYNEKRIISIQLTKPSDTGLSHVAGNYAGIIIITPTTLESINHEKLHARDSRTEGTIESVVSSILKQSGGNLDCFSTPSGIPLYRISLPHASADQITSQQISLPLGLEAYIANWNVLLCKDKNSLKKLKNYMESCKVNIEYTNSIVDTLSRIERGNDLNAIIINGATLGQDRDGLLRAIIKLCPQAGLVIIDNVDPKSQPLSADVVFIPTTHSPAQTAQAMIEAKTLARVRHKGTV